MTNKPLFKQKIIKKLMLLTLTLCLLTASIPAYGDAVKKPEDVENIHELTQYSRSFILSDVDGYYNIFEYNASKPLGIASLTKLTTLSIILEELEKGNLNLTDTVTISEHALSQDGNGLKLHVGEQMSVDDLLHGMLICSSNDAAVALAEHIAGSESEFVKLMNQKAKSLDLSSVSFVNASGLTRYDSAHNTLPDQNMMSSTDLQKLTRYLLNKYPTLTEITNLENWTLSSKQIIKHNTNALLKTIPEVNGFKTGFTNFAGYCQVTTANIDFEKVNTDVIDEITHEFNDFSSEKEVVSIVLGAPSKYRKNIIATTLINYAKDQCQLYVLSKENVPVYTEAVPVPDNYGIFPSDTIAIPYPKSGNIQYTIILNPLWKMSPQFMPLLPVGKIVFYDNDQYILDVDLIIKELPHN